MFFETTVQIPKIGILFIFCPWSPLFVQVDAMAAAVTAVLVMTAFSVRLGAQWRSAFTDGTIL